MSQTCCEQAGGISHCLSETRRDDRETYLVVSQLDPRNHDDPPVPRVPIIVADQTALTRRALSRAEFGHAEPNVRMSVHGRGVENGDSVPAGLDLDGEVTLKAVRGFDVTENGFKGGVLKGGAVHVASDPAGKKGKHVSGSGACEIVEAHLS
jgi:hypothetical protein